MTVREVGSDEQARVEGFIGSPTIRIDGRDIQPPQDEPTGLACRIYRRRDGRVSPTPDPLDLREALRAASGAESPSGPSGVDSCSGASAVESAPTP
ncbi:MAG TPA: hypothetical protein VMI13_01780 [Solirubrobacteraceae bacterium]|nr:hypothetical protein [Solirubrobacteraceae bacterium]